MNEPTLLRAHGIVPWLADHRLGRRPRPSHPYRHDPVLAELVVHVIDAHHRALNPAAVDDIRLEALHRQLHGLVGHGEYLDLLR